MPCLRRVNTISRPEAFAAGASRDDGGGLFVE